MTKARPGFNRLPRPCEGRFRGRTPCARMARRVRRGEKEDLFARIRFRDVRGEPPPPGGR